MNAPNHNIPPVSPRFADAVPAELAADAHPPVNTQDATLDNPDDFPTRELDTVVSPNPDGTPRLAGPHHNVTPLDLAQARAIVEERHTRWAGIEPDDEPYTGEIVHNLEVRDSSRKYVFDGVRLSYVSSELPGKDRWTEISIYRTAGGLYIAHKVAVSTVVHYDGCLFITRYGKRYTSISGIASDEFKMQDRIACPECIRPASAYQDILQTTPEVLRFERDRHNVWVVETPESVIQALYTTKKGVKKLGSLAASAIQVSSDRDAPMAAVFYGRQKDPS